MNRQKYFHLNCLYLILIILSLFVAFFIFCVCDLPIFDFLRTILLSWLSFSYLVVREEPGVWILVTPLSLGRILNLYWVLFLLQTSPPSSSAINHHSAFEEHLDDLTKGQCAIYHNLIMAEVAHHTHRSGD